MLTDGDNTRGPLVDHAVGDRRAHADGLRQREGRANIKIYTVRVINGNATLLRNCATNPTMYYDVQQASELNSVFTSIAQKLATLRISK